MLKVAVFGVGVLLLAAALLVLTAFGSVPVAILLAINGALIVGGVLFERSRYRPSVDRKRGRWERTGERFVDPSTGHQVEVFYNPDTGQRDYVER